MHRKADGKILKECIWNDFPPSQSIFLMSAHSEYLKI